MFIYVLRRKSAHNVQQSFSDSKKIFFLQSAFQIRLEKRNWAPEAANSATNETGRRFGKLFFIVLRGMQSFLK
jgi:hypothetical protein